MNKEEFIEKARKVHGDKYDYSKVVYKNARTKVCIICPEHGEFWQEAFSHTKGCKCQACAGSKKLTTEEFIEKAKEVHGNKYDYSKVEYKNNRTPICIICPEHGEFWQLPTNHLKGCGCKHCKGKSITEKKLLTTEEFIKKAKKVHGDKYDYSKVVYKSAKEDVCIICPEHGEFWQLPTNHLKGCGCPFCKNWRMEEECCEVFKKIGIIFEREKKFKWLKHKKSLFLDFYLPDYNIAIECQGKQHFNEVTSWGGKEGLEERKERDKSKLNSCKENGVRLEYIYYDDNVEERIKEILKWGNQ